MAVEAALVSLLRNDVRLATLVGTRIYPLTVPGGQTPDWRSRPCVLYHQVLDLPVVCHSGPSGLWAAQFELAGLSSGYSTARALALMAVRAVAGYVGTVAGVMIRAATVQPYKSLLFGVPPEEHDLLLNVWRVRRVLAIWYREVA